MSFLRRLRISPLVRLLSYYLLVFLVAKLAVLVVPRLGVMLTVAVEDAIPAAAQLSDALGGEAYSGAGGATAACGGGAWCAAAAATLAMVGALVFSLPVAWIYTVTKRRKGWDESVVQLMIMLPIAVTAVVFVVRNSIALAFALAGIVAAVRFRTTFKDVRDAVFAFVAIGIGIASGVELWILAGVLSLFFALLTLSLWKWEIGKIYGDVAVVGETFSLTDGFGGTGGSAVGTVGDASLLAASATDAERGTRLGPHLEAELAREQKKRYQHVLVVHASKLDAGKDAVEEVLADSTKRWQLVHVIEEPAGYTLEYLVRLKKRVEVPEFLAALQAEGEGGTIRAAELRPVDQYER